MSDGAFSNPLKGRNQAMAFFALVAGLVMVIAYYTRKQLYNSSNALTFVIYVGVGGLLILIGLRMIGGGLLAQSGRLRPGQIVRWYRASMPGPALAYLGILFILLVGSLMGRASPAASNMLLLTFGTGIGSGLFVDGVLVPNTELGHIEIDGEEVPFVSTFQLFIISRGADGPPELELQTRTSLINFNFTAESLTDYFLVLNLLFSSYRGQFWTSVPPPFSLPCCLGHIRGTVVF